MTGNASNAGPGRVLERRRAVALARHYREFEGLPIRQIADRLGRSPATVKAYFYDPTGEKARAVKARYQGVCRGCGAYTQPRNGKGDAYAYCKACHPGAIGRRWTRERVLDAMAEWRSRYGRLPSSYDWSFTHARRRREMPSSDLPEESGHQRASLPRSSEHGPPPAPRRCVRRRTPQRDRLDAIPALCRFASHADGSRLSGLGFGEYEVSCLTSSEPCLRIRAGMGARGVRVVPYVTTAVTVVSHDRLAAHSNAAELGKLVNTVIRFAQARTDGAS